MWSIKPEETDQHVLNTQSPEVTEMITGLAVLSVFNENVTQKVKVFLVGHSKEIHPSATKADLQESVAGASAVIQPHWFVCHILPCVAFFCLSQQRFSQICRASFTCVQRCTTSSAEHLKITILNSKTKIERQFQPITSLSAAKARTKLGSYHQQQPASFCLNHTGLNAKLS